MSAAPRECEVVAFFLVHEHRQDLPIHPQNASTSTGFGRTATPCGTRSGADIDITTGNIDSLGSRFISSSISVPVPGEFVSLREIARCCSRSGRSHPRHRHDGVRRCAVEALFRFAIAAAWWISNASESTR